MVHKFHECKPPSLIAEQGGGGSVIRSLVFWLVRKKICLLKKEKWGAWLLGRAFVPVGGLGYSALLSRRALLGYWGGLCVSWRPCCPRLLGPRRPPAPIDQRDLPLNQVFEYPNTGAGVTIFMMDTAHGFSQAPGHLTEGGGGVGATVPLAGRQRSPTIMQIRRTVCTPKAVRPQLPSF